MSMRCEMIGGGWVALGLVACSAMAAEIKVVTEYVYPTGFDVTPVMGIGGIGMGGLATVAGGVVEPTDFERREVGVVMRVDAVVGRTEDGRVVAASDAAKKNGNTPLVLAASAGDVDKVRALVARGADVNAKNRYGSTALMAASAGGFTNVVAMLLDKKADANAKSARGFTALMFAAKNGHGDVAKALVGAGARVDAEDGDGHTPVMYAADAGDGGMVRFLAEHGASLDRKDKRGKTALALARAAQHDDVVVLLTQLRKP